MCQSTYRFIDRKGVLVDFQDLEGYALVTGGTGGIGSAVCRLREREVVKRSLFSE